VHAGSYPDGFSQRIPFDTAAEILVAAAVHGTFNLHCIVHDVNSLNQAAYLPSGNHKASVPLAG
jgi:hypothetical protein